MPRLLEFVSELALFLNANKFDFIAWSYIFQSADE